MRVDETPNFTKAGWLEEAVADRALAGP